jgi:hypothetical protein
MKILPGPFGHVEVEKVRYKPKCGLYLPFITNKSVPSAFVRVLSEGRYKDMIAVVHPGYVTEVDVPGLNTYITKISDVRAWIEPQEGEEFYKLDTLRHTPEGSEWTNLT